MYVFGARVCQRASKRLVVENMRKELVYFACAALAPGCSGRSSSGTDARAGGVTGGTGSRGSGRERRYRRHRRDDDRTRCARRRRRRYHARALGVHRSRRHDAPRALSDVVRAGPDVRPRADHRPRHDSGLTARAHRPRARCARRKRLRHDDAQLPDVRVTAIRPSTWPICPSTYRPTRSSRASTARTTACS